MMSDVITWKYEPQEGNEVACITEYYDGRMIRFVCEFATDPATDDGALMASAPSLRDDVESLRAQLSEARASLDAMTREAVARAQEAGELAARLAEIERQDPVAVVAQYGDDAWSRQLHWVAGFDKLKLAPGTKLYAAHAAPAAPAAQAAQPVSDAYKSAAHAVEDDVVRDAERYRFIRSMNEAWMIDRVVDALNVPEDEFDAHIDSAILAAQQQKGDK